MPRSGSLLCLASATAFGAMGVVGKLAYDEGATVGTLLATRFVWLSGLALVSTVGAITLFLAGLRRVGPTAASFLSTLEPVVTVALAFVVFGESPRPVQLAGGALVLLAVLAVRAPVRSASATSPAKEGSAS